MNEQLFLWPERAGSREPVRNYRNLAITAFRNTARRAFGELVSLSHYPDWEQECELAAWQCERAGLTLTDAVRFCSRSCYRFLRNLGFRRPTGGSGMFLFA